MLDLNSAYYTKFDWKKLYYYIYFLFYFVLYAVYNNFK